VQLVPSGQSPREVRAIQGEPLSEADVARLLRQTVSAGSFAAGNDEVFRISIAGAQEKTALLKHGGQWCRPLGATPTTHILKLPLGMVGNMQADMKESVELEWLCMELARDVGLPVANVALGQFEDQKALVVERFDRRLSNDGTWWQRLPQEDLCQATGTPPDKKYETDGGPGVRRIMELLRSSEQAPRDRLTFFETQVFFWLIAATDGHAKNFSLQLLPGGRFQMTPLYDILSTYPIQGRKSNQLDPRDAALAMAVESKNRHYKISEIQRRHWITLAESLGLEADVRELLPRLIERTRAAVQSVSQRIPPGFPQRLCDSVFEGTRAACARLEAAADQTAAK
jgi:serine/threonine-protein kinase HipA